MQSTQTSSGTIKNFTFDSERMQYIFTDSIGGVYSFAWGINSTATLLANPYKKPIFSNDGKRQENTNPS